MTTGIQLINFEDAAARLIAEWGALNDDEREDIPAFATAGYGPLPFTVNDDFSVVLGNYTDGLVGGGSETSVKKLAESLNDTAACLDYDHAEMTTPLRIG